MLPLVSIDVPADTLPVLAAITVRACDATLGAGRCRLSAERFRANDSAWTASIVVSEAAGGFRIELGSTEPKQVQIRFSRTLEFDANEPDARRWSTLGVVVAALVVDATASRANAGVSQRHADTATAGDASAASAVRGLHRDLSAPPALHRSSAASARPHQSSAAPIQTKDARSGQGDSLRARLAIQAAYSRSDANSSGRVGVHALPSLMLSGPVFGWLGVGVSVASRSVVTRAWSGAMGIGFASTPQAPGFGVEGRLGLAGELLTFRVERGGETDQAVRWRHGPLAGLDLRLTLTPSLDLLVLVSGSVLFPTVQVKVAGNSVDQHGLLQGAAGVGLRVHFSL